VTDTLPCGTPSCPCGAPLEPEGPLHHCWACFDRGHDEDLRESRIEELRGELDVVSRRVGLFTRPTDIYALTKAAIEAELRGLGVSP